MTLPSLSVQIQSTWRVIMQTDSRCPLTITVRPLRSGQPRCGGLARARSVGFRTVYHLTGLDTHPGFVAHVMISCACSDSPFPPHPRPYVVVLKRLDLSVTLS